MPKIPFKQNTKVIGRFAPSPTGPLHFGSLVAATASYLHARYNPNSEWYLRIEDLDTQRSHSKHTASIIHTLEKFCFEWDGDIVYQSDRTSYYQDALDNLKDTVYPCSCTRKFLKATLSDDNTFGYIYPGNCRDSLTIENSSHLSTRIRTYSEQISFTDSIQGIFGQDIQNDVGDFILKRADGSFAYQLAVVVDDHLQGINQIVRGADLFDNTPRQIYLQKLLGFDTPQYSHIPVAVDQRGKKLSKQNLAPDVNNHEKTKSLIKVLTFLGQDTPNRDDFSNLGDFWTYAVQNWDQSKIPKTLTQYAPPYE